jgi:nitrogen fixation NifU-like protein
MYSKTVMDHFRKPRNVGVIEDADGIGEIGNPLCGDMMTIYLKIADDHIEDIKFQTFGCGSAIAVSSMLTEIAKGKSIEEAKKITNKDVAAALDGLPKK